MNLDQVKRWREGDVLFAENWLLKMAYAITDDPEKVGTLGWHGEGGSAICVEYISRAQAEAWPQET